jgi:hypothetical protein
VHNRPTACGKNFAMAPEMGRPAPRRSYAPGDVDGECLLQHGQRMAGSIPGTRFRFGIRPAAVPERSHYEYG